LKATKPDPEEVRAISSDFQSPELREWYPKEVAQLSFPASRVVCQRSNCWWDSKLRRIYRVGLAVLLFVICGSLIGLAIALNLTVAGFVLSLMAPILPFLLWGIRETQDQADAAKRADELKSFGDDLWQAILAKKLTVEETGIRSRVFQDGILDHRQKSPHIFDWVYWIFRNAFEDQMKYGARDMISEAQQLGL
jgi:hypothetical protein